MTGNARLEADFAAERRRMVREQLTTPGRDITHRRVLEVMGEVPRHEFVPSQASHQAYEDRPLPIGWGQTISQPFIVAFMTQELEPQPTQRVLEIGTGCGYQTAVLSRLVHEVYTIEIREPLGPAAAANLLRLGCANVHTRIADGSLGWPEAAPFDAILVTCAPPEVPEALVHQLKEGGRMVIPVGPPGEQNLLVLEKKHGRILRQNVLAVRFVPMTTRSPDERPFPIPPFGTAE